MKKQWQQPVVDELKVSFTMNGPGIRDVDATYEDEDEIVHLNES